jgi:hypothetical protein
MNKHTVFIFTLCASCILLSGCVNPFEDISIKSTTYESHPTQVSYHIIYGYQVNLTGTGESTVSYREDLPDTFRTIITNQSIINKRDATLKINGNNEMILWNETFHDDQEIFLGISADVMAESLLISDLCGSAAIELSEIKKWYPDLIASYCTSQKNETIIYIDPNNPQITQIADMVKTKSKTNNSLVVAKNLFVWLKTNTTYQAHLINQQLQSCQETLEKKTGDCDDLSFLYISLCRAVSIPARFIRGFLIDSQNSIRTITPHVWVEVFVGGGLGNNGWIPVECAGSGNLDAEVHQNFGVEDAHHLRLSVDDGSNESLERYTNHISITYATGITIDLDHHSEISAYTILDSKNLCITDDSSRNYC